MEAAKDEVIRLLRDCWILSSSNKQDEGFGLFPQR